MPVTRRSFLQSIPVGAVSLLGPRLLQAAQTPFQANYALPQVDYGQRQGSEVFFNLSLMLGETEFLPNLQTPTMGINGAYLGPVLRARRGDTVHIRVSNQLGEDSTLHWHGFVLPAAMDGGPHQVIPNGAEWTASFDIVQPAGTYWYHSHQLHRTGPQVYQGLAGMFVIDDEVSTDLSLPAEWGVDDFPVVIQDRDFAPDGRFAYINMMPEKMHGKHGSQMLVNGVIQPVLKPAVGLVRLRLLNGSNARVYRLAFDDGRPMRIIAGDGGLLPTPVAVRELLLAPAERCEVIVDLTDGGQPVLRNLTGAVTMRGMMGMMMSRMGFDREFDILRIDAGQARKSNRAIPDQLPSAVRDLAPDSAAGTRPMALSMRMMGMMGGGGGGFSINGRSMDMARIDERLRRGTREIWVVSNDSPMPHPFHVHNTQFRVLNRNGQAPRAHERGLKDTVLVGADERVEILVPSGPYADSERPYMYHCHNLEHEDQGMMGQFVVEA